MLWNSISTFIKMQLSVGDRLAEEFYGIWMVTVVTGLVRASGKPTEQSVRIMLFAALGTNITWGIIDGLTSIFSDLVDRTKEDEIIHSLRTDKGNQKNKQAAMDSLNNTIVRHLSEADQSKVIDMIQSGATEKPLGSRLSREDYEVAFATFLIDFLAIFPVVLPYLIFNSIHLAMQVSQIVATCAFIIIGFAWAKHAHLNRVRTAIAFGLTGIAVIAFSYAFGW
jgi:VIT1/CCC1 family predicted Fe2+/Mn2+ transporter